MGVALKQETRTVPVVFNGVSDPIGYGLVASLARPGGNLTGFLLYEEGIVGKWLAMLTEIAPHLTRVALIAHPKAGPLWLFPEIGRPRCSQRRDRVDPEPGRKRRRY
jgi:ABC-type uncharacterized transport system substrate-binding protein